MERLLANDEILIMGIVSLLFNLFFFTYLCIFWKCKSTYILNNGLFCLGWKLEFGNLFKDMEKIDAKQERWSCTVPIFTNRLVILFEYKKALLTKFNTSFWLQNNLWYFTAHTNKFKRLFCSQKLALNVIL